MKTWWCLLILGICVLDSIKAEDDTEAQNNKEGEVRGFFPIDFSTKNDYNRKCGDTSTMRRTIWKNPEYPETEELPGLCTLYLTPPAGTCAYRILFDDMDLRTGDDWYWTELYECNPRDPYFKATTPDDLTAVYCQNMDGYEGILEVPEDSSEPTVLLLQLDPEAKSKFRLNITAVSCDDIETFQSPQTCGIKNKDFSKLQKGLLRDIDSEDSQESDAKPNRKLRRITKQKAKNKKQMIRQKEEGNANIKESSQIYNLIEEGVTDAKSKGKLEESERTLSKVLGNDFFEHKYPWNVYLESEIWDDVWYPCNGILLDDSRVLTSRSCVVWNPQQPFGVDDIRLFIGDHDILDLDDVDAEHRSVSRITVPLVNGLYDTNDQFAILHLDEKVELSDTIRPICMPVDYNNFPKDSGVVAGWDWTQSELSVPYEAKVFLTDNHTCYAAIDELAMYFEAEEYFNMEYDSEDIVCALDKDWNDGVVCTGEGGSPLIQRDITGAYYVTGVASGLNVCEYDGFPTVFSKVEPNNQFLNIALA